MKFLTSLLLLFVVVMVSAVNLSMAKESANQLTERLQELDGAAIQEPAELNRHKRLTCEIDRSLCLLHCRLKGYLRAYCSQQKVCRCVQ
uniref:Sapecin-B n=1 Tax=Sarcophaga peregrina TaxID=7386 RepID=SAPB_SARPE|nr:RecName: Full=Sapecin-B; Flags: Precursor [Sarcophaga peregrina]AAB35004.1 sapecin B [Sarcophaga peregrina]